MRDIQRIAIQASNTGPAPQCVESCLALLDGCKPEPFGELTVADVEDMKITEEEKVSACF